MYISFVAAATFYDIQRNNGNPTSVSKGKKLLLFLKLITVNHDDTLLWKLHSLLILQRVCLGRRWIIALVIGYKILKFAT